MQEGVQKLLFAFVLVATVTVSAADGETCSGISDEDQHFANLCFKPKSLLSFDFNWYLFTTQPEDGWYLPLGTNITSRNWGESIHGRHLKIEEDYNRPCFRAKFTADHRALDVHLTGFGNMKAIWKCGPSLDHRVVSICTGISDGARKFHNYFNIFPVHTDYKKFVLNMICFPNGETGWYVIATEASLSENEKLKIAEEVNKRGFKYEEHILFYDELRCSK